MFHITVLPSAERDIEQNFAYWSQTRSSDQSERWYSSIYQAIQTLKLFPKRCPAAEEADLHPTGIRVLFFGIGQHPTHRILFTVIESDVYILRVRHLSQNFLTDVT
ncbi:MAG: type II toxin-antitoxin system RelE/ParE family toxin [Pirellulaceae bacterium]|nr:type II toxin-antitoxin system RelE/ParE family toxin [Pirellulaceae bacterium]